MDRVSRTKTSSPVEAEPRFEGDASLERGGDRVRGSLAITHNELRFEPSERRRERSLRIPLDEIEDVSPTRQRLLGLIPAGANGIKVRSRRGIYRFIVDGSDRSRWLREFASAVHPHR